MQIPSVLPLTNTPPAAPTARQQVELAQEDVANGTPAAVRPSIAQAVTAPARSEEQQSLKDALKGKPRDAKELQDTLKQLNDVAKLYNSQLEFSVDKETHIQVVKVIDKDSGKVIRQIPSEDAVRIAKAIDDFKGLLLKDKA